jgi:hypothetical protein
MLIKAGMYGQILGKTPPILNFMKIQALFIIVDARYKHEDYS